MRIPLIGSTYQLESLQSCPERTVNRYLEIIESPNGKNKARLVRTPGRVSHCSLAADGSIRGLLAGYKRLFAAAGTNLYEVFENGNKTLLGSIGGDNNTPVRMNLNGNSIFVSSSGLGYLATGISVVQTVDSQSSAFVDRYYISGLPNSDQFAISLDGANWDLSLDVGQKAGYPDNIAAVFADLHGLLWLFGNDTIEVWQDTGNAAFPFERITGASISQGAVSPWAIGNLADGPIWAGSGERGQGVVWKANGYRPVRVSNHAIEQTMDRFSRLDDCEVFTYQDRGHFFAVFNFPTADRTLVYDDGLPPEIAWHERGLWNSQLGRYQMDRPRCHAFVWNKHFVGSHREGIIYRQETEFLDDAGLPIRRLRVVPLPTKENAWMNIAKVEVEIQRGMGAGGAATTPGYDPQIVMRQSNDGGETYGNEHRRSMGKQGEYRKRALWYNRGRARNPVLEFVDSDPIDSTLIDGYAEVS